MDATAGAQVPTSAADEPRDTDPVAEADAPPVRLPGTFYLGASDIDWTGRESGTAAFAIGFDVSGPITDRTRMTFALSRGPADLLSAFTVANSYRTTARATITNPGWNLAFGELTTAHSALYGPSIRADGAAVSIRRRVVADLTLARPYYFGAASGGHLAQGRFGIRTSAGTFAVVGSDLAKPSTVQPIAAPAPTAASSEIPIGELGDAEQLITRRSRLRAWGFEADLRFGRRTIQSVLARAGTLELANQLRQTTHGGAGELYYAVKRAGYTFSGYARRVPASLPGAFVPGNAVTAAGSVPIKGDLAATVRGYSNVDSLLGRSTPIRSTGISGGIQRTAGGTQFSLQFSEKRVHSPVPKFNTFTDTVIGSATLPLGPVRFDLRAEAGPARRGTITRSIQSYSATVTIQRDAWSVFGAGRYEDRPFQPPMARADAGVSADIRDVHLEVGAGYGTGQLLGNSIGGWAKVETPLLRGFRLVTQIDYFRWDYNASPYLTLLLEDPAPSPWRITFGIRRTLNVPIPFVHRKAGPRSSSTTGG